jgi:hypothetical protein
LIATFALYEMTRRSGSVNDLFQFTIGVNHEQFANYRDLQLTPELLRVRAGSDKHHNQIASLYIKGSMPMILLAEQNLEGSLEYAQSLLNNLYTKLVTASD